jgi:hypothetical protein
MDRWFIDRRRERTHPDDTDSNPKLTFRADHQVGRRERYPGFISLAPRLCCRDDLSNAISMSAAYRIGSTRKAAALFNRTSNGVGATACGSRGTNQYDCSLGPDIDTCTSFLERQTDARRPHVSPINSAREPQGQAVDVRPAPSSCANYWRASSRKFNTRRRPSSSE